MAVGIENQRLAEWLQLMGCPVELSSEDLQKINTVNMRSVWRHLQRHVMPVQNVQTVRKNLLLEEVSRKNVQREFGNFKVESLNELVQVQNFAKVKEELTQVKNKINDTDKELLSDIKSFTKKKVMKENLKSELLEEEKKIALLNLKLKSCQKEIDKFDQDIENACLFKTFPFTALMPENNDNILQVSSIVKRSSIHEITDEYVNEIIWLTLQYPPAIIYNGINLASTTALKSLRTSIDFDIHSTDFEASKFNTLLNLLNRSVFKSKLELFNLVEKVKADKALLKKDQTELVKFVKEYYDQTSCEKIEKLIEKVIQNIILQKSLEKTREIICDLGLCSHDFSCMKTIVDSLGDQETKLLEEVYSRRLAINNIIFKILSSNVSSLKSEIHEKCCEIVANFLFKQRNGKHSDIFEASENLIKKEVDLFQKSSLFALSRKWEDSLAMVPMGFQPDIAVIRIPERFNLIYFTLQSEPKTLIKHILEKLCWLDLYNM